MMIKYSSDPERFICHFEGSMDMAECLGIEGDLFAKVSGVKTAVVFDLAKVDYVSSDFLRLCMKTAQHIGLDKLSLVGLCPEIKKVFKIACFDKLIAIE